jgi:hypothetical protein
MERRFSSNSNLINSKFKIDMKKTYLIPALQEGEAQAIQMLAESLQISNDTVSGSEALTKEDGAWEIWDEDEE